MNRSHHGAVVKCEATNDIGTTHKETTLDVHCEYIALKLKSIGSLPLNLSFLI